MIFFSNNANTFEVFQKMREKIEVPIAQILTVNEKIGNKAKKEEMELIWEDYKYGLKPNKNPFLFIDSLVFENNDIHIFISRTIAGGGVLMKNNIPWKIESFLQKVSLFQESLKVEEEWKERKKEIESSYKEEVKEWKIEKKALKEAYKETLKLWKEDVKKVKEENKLLEKEYEEVLKKSPKEVRKFIQEPEYKELPEKPEEPLYPEKPDEPYIAPRPKAYSMKAENQDKSFGWYVFRSVKIYQCEELNLIFLEKRREKLNFTMRNLEEGTKILKISKDDLAQKIKTLDKKVEVEQSLLNGTLKGLVAKYEEKFDDILFSEQVEGVKEVSLPPLAPIKPMHAASMLAGGSNFSHELVLNKENVAVKSAIVKTYDTRTINVLGVQQEETIEHYVQKMGVYNLDRRDLKILE